MEFVVNQLDILSIKNFKLFCWSYDSLVLFPANNTKKLYRILGTMTKRLVFGAIGSMVDMKKGYLILGTMINNGPVVRIKIHNTANPGSLGTIIFIDSYVGGSYLSEPLQKVRMSAHVNKKTFLRNCPYI